MLSSLIRLLPRFGGVQQGQLWHEWTHFLPSRRSMAVWVDVRDNNVHEALSRCAERPLLASTVLGPCVLGVKLRPMLATVFLDMP
jgi:hypothetical protein